MERRGPSPRSRRCWTCRAQPGEAPARRGVKVRSWGDLGVVCWGGGVDSPCINSTRRLCQSSGYTSSLRNAASLQSKHGVTSSALTQGALLSGGAVKNKGDGCQSGSLADLLEVNESGWRSRVKEILGVHAAREKCTRQSVSETFKGYRKIANCDDYRWSAGR